MEFGLGKGFRTVEPAFRDVHLSIATGAFVATTCGFTLSPEWRIQMEFQEPASAPLLLSRPFGNGRIIFWNASCLHLKEMRGMFLFSLLRAMPTGTMSVFNSFLFQIDDSPPPAFGLKEGPVMRDLGLVDYQFYRHHWYPKVMRILDDSGIRASHFLCFNYGGKVDGPFEANTDRDEFFREILALILKRGDEIAFHGYNHQSLTVASGPSTPWPSEEKMIESLKVGARMWRSFRLPRTMLYVPPNNVIDEVGKSSLRKGFESLRAVCRLYVGKGEEYAVEAFDDSNAGDEFGPDPDEPGLLNVPRLSSGMFLTDSTRLGLVNGIMTHGIVNHFVHPDDMYDPGRRGRDWESSLANFRYLIRFSLENLPGAEKLETSKFLVPLKKFEACQPTVTTSSDGKITWKVPGLGRRFWYVFSRKPVDAWIMTGSRLVQTLEPGRVFLFEITKDQATARPDR